MRIGKVTYNSTASDSLGIFVSGKGTYDAADLDATSYEIPGRNGCVILSNHRYKNIDVKYPAFIPGSFESGVQAVRNWMRSAEGYAMITDNFDTTHYRMGVGKGVLSFSPVDQNIAANCQLVFNCKPQRFLTSGDTEQTLTTGAVLTNATPFPAKPLIRVVKPTASATITFTGSAGTFTLTATGAYNGTLYIDCDTMNIYNGNTNLNSKFTGEFPVIGTSATVTFSNVTSLHVKPRWWEL